MYLYLTIPLLILLCLHILHFTRTRSGVRVKSYTFISDSYQLDIEMSGKEYENIYKSVLLCFKNKKRSFSPSFVSRNMWIPNI